MFGVSSGMRIFLCRDPVDMRKSYDGLANLVENHFHEDPLCGFFFLFMNRQRNRLKILFWDSGGCACSASVSRRAASVCRRERKIRLTT